MTRSAHAIITWVPLADPGAIPFIKKKKTLIAKEDSYYFWERIKKSNNKNSRVVLRFFSFHSTNYSVKTPASWPYLSINDDTPDSCWVSLV
jgi:hypothetical protein